MTRRDSTPLLTPPAHPHVRAGLKSIHAIVMTGVIACVFGSTTSAIAQVAKASAPAAQSNLQCEEGLCAIDDKAYGTALRWSDTPDEAYRLADRQGKLVFLIHISGNFRIPGFT